MKLSDPIHRFLPEWRDVEVSVERPDGSVELVDTEQPISVKHASMHMTGIGTGSPEARLNLEALVDGGGARSLGPAATAGVGPAGDFMWGGSVDGVLDRPGRGPVRGVRDAAHPERCVRLLRPTPLAGVRGDRRLIICAGVADASPVEFRRMSDRGPGEQCSE